jgi:hypothetical protein
MSGFALAILPVVMVGTQGAIDITAPNKNNER